jgi:hypothetical protein
MPQLLMCVWCWKVVKGLEMSRFCMKNLFNHIIAQQKIDWNLSILSLVWHWEFMYLVDNLQIMESLHMILELALGILQLQLRM